MAAHGVDPSVHPLGEERRAEAATAGKHSRSLCFSLSYKMETQEKRIRAIAESVKVSTSFVHKTCKNLGPQTFEIPACKN